MRTGSEGSRFNDHHKGFSTSTSTLAIDDVFFAESQFSIESNTSKLASAVSERAPTKWGFASRDTRWMTEYHRKAGCVIVPRAEFNALVEQHAFAPMRTELWEVDAEATELLSRKEHEKHNPSESAS